jgi:hypothetical protein
MPSLGSHASYVLPFDPFLIDDEIDQIQGISIDKIETSG